MCTITAGLLQGVQTAVSLKTPESWYECFLEKKKKEKKKKVMSIFTKLNKSAQYLIKKRKEK